MIRVFILSLVLLSASAVAAPRTIAAGGAWVAFDRGGSCDAMARSVLVARGDREQARIAVSFDRAGPRHGQVSTRLRRPVRSGSSVILTIGDRPFLLIGHGADAWSKGPAQEAAIIAAIRVHTGMRIEARDSSGRRMVDRYLLDGAPTAIDAAAAACSRKR